MPRARRNTPAPIKNKGPNKALLNALSAWTDDGEPLPPPPPQQARGSAAQGDGDTGRSYKELGQEGEGGDEQALTLSSRLKDYLDVERPTFNMIVGIIVICNAVVIGLETDMGKEYFVPVEHLFILLFSAEMVIRVHQLGFKKYIQDAWHIFDCVILGIGVLDTWVLPLITVGTGGSHAKLSNITALRLLRILRVLRVLRIVRLLRMFSTLFLLTRAIARALQVVLSMGVLIAIVNYVLAIFLTQVVGHRAKDFAADEALVQGWFGTIGASMRTLFTVMTFDGWSNIVNTLCEVFPPMPVVLFFTAYITFASYTLVSLVTAVLSSSLIQAQEETKEQRMNRIETLSKFVANELRDNVNDAFGEEPHVPAEELKSFLKGDVVLFGKLEECEINIGESGVLSLVDQLAHGDQISVDHFVEKLIHLSGAAKASAVIDLKFRVANIESKVDSVLEKLEAIAQKVK